MKVFCVSILMAIFTCTAQANIKKDDPLKELFASLGTVEAENLMLKNEYSKLRETQPHNEKYIQCLEQQLTLDSTAEYLRPYFMKILTMNDVIIFRDFVKTKAGIKFVDLSKNPSKYAQYKSIFNEIEQKELDEFTKKLEKYFTKETSLLMRNASLEAGRKIYKDSDAKCAPLSTK